MAKLKFKSSNKFIFYKFSDNFFYLFFIYIKKSNNLSVEYYQENKERLLKKHMKDIKIFLKKKKKKSNNMVMNITKILQKIKKKNWLSTEKNIISEKKMLYYNYKKVF